MLISRVSDNEGGLGEGVQETEGSQDHSHEYQTASELFEMMAKNQDFNSSDGETLTTRDLVLLYKNIDLGTKLMTDANEIKFRRPNQYVETVVYQEDPESDGSDLSEIYSNEDLHNVVLINKERIDLLNSQPSLENNTLCHKFGDLEIQSSALNTEYDKNFLFKDPYIKEQLRGLNLITNPNEFEGRVLPASLLDYICCKRLEDNYNFYMDNIIRYVKHTIEQLKRISNGDYLTDKAKEKWREVEHHKDIDDASDTKVLATSTSIPLHVEHKVGGLISTWDDLVHSEVDVRSLSKILEKKIILEVPKLICGSYKLLSKCCADNVIISCQKDKLPVEKTTGGSRVNVVFQLQRSNSGQVVSNISSIMILQTAPPPDSAIIDTLPLTYELPKKNNISENNVKIIELENDENIPIINPLSPINETVVNTKDYASDDLGTDGSFMDSLDYPCSDYGNMSHLDPSCLDSSASSLALRDLIDQKVNPNEVTFNIAPPDDLNITMQKLNVQSTLPEESGEDLSPSAVKRRSPTRVRIKSPYENKSHVMEEKKRKKLLEIRERREKKKMAMAENCKISKHKYAKSAIMPQPSSSVTKLSITNKSFYNSIYGQSPNFDKQAKGKGRKATNKDAGDVEVDETEEDTEPVTSEIDLKKYINRSYYLDDTVTEMMYLEMKNNDKQETCSVSTSEVSNDFHSNLNLLSQLIGPSITDLKDPEINDEPKSNCLVEIVQNEEKNPEEISEVPTSQTIHNVAPSASPPVNNFNKLVPKKSSSSIECRRSIDKIYELMKKLGTAGNPENKLKLAINTERFNIIGGRGSSTVQGSDSGTSLKHHLTSSNPSWFSFEKNTNVEVKVPNIQNKETDTPTTVIPKVIISSKSQIPKLDTEKSKKDSRKIIMSTLPKVSDNPLQAISQLLQEFENVQKIRQKSAVEQKPKKPDAILVPEIKITSRQNPTKRRSRLDQPTKENASQNDRSPKNSAPQKKPRQSPDSAKNIHQQNLSDDRHGEKIAKKKIVDIIDEVKEARGEAVRGPSKINSRLNSLAQPKKSYVQAHSEEYQFKYGKTLMTDRLQRLAAAQPPSPVEKNMPPAIRNKLRRTGTEPVSAVSVKPPSSPVPPLDRASRFRCSNSSSPVEKALSPGRGPSTKQSNVPESPETLKKKMVAVESYVKNHFGFPTGLVAASGPLQPMQISRVPLLPTDLELASLTSSPSPNEEATAIGSKLHRIIDTMLNTTHELGVLAECQEPNTKTVKDNTDDDSLDDNLIRCDEHISTDSEFNADIFGDKNVQTAVENVQNVTRKEIEEFGEVNTLDCVMLTHNSTEQLGILENALYRRLSVGTFQQRLRVKNLTLTPKQSMQQVVCLQSGDAGSLLIKSTLSQHLKMNSVSIENLQHLKDLPVLSRSQINWGLAKFPMQVATVGYAFPQYQSVNFPPKIIKSLSEVSKSVKNKASGHFSSKNDKDSQCFKGEHRIQLQQVAQTDEVKQILSGIININHEGSFQEPEQIKVAAVATDETKETRTDADEHVDKKEKIEKSCEDQSTPTVPKETNSTDDTPANSGPIDYTTSLDVLVGLLNEIKKITTCQTHMTSPNEDSNNSPDCKELETILNNAAAIENSVHSCSPREIISITSLDKLRQLESNPSIYSFYLSDDEDKDRGFSTINIHSDVTRSVIAPLPCPKPICIDKEVEVDMEDRKLVSTFTNVPSKFLPIAVNHSTNVTSSLIGVISEPSTQSLYSFSEYRTVYSKTSSLNTHKNIIELQIAEGRLQVPSIHNKVELENVIKGEQMVNKRIKIIEKTAKTQKRIKQSDLCLLTSDFDPMMKMKRDVLVTVYSVLVFTVFAALSFPQLFYHV